MAKFLTPDGKTDISKEEFVKLYSDIYYWRNSIFVEEKIFDLLYKNKLSPRDVFDILAWKTGKINHKKSEQNKKMIYYKGWREDDLKATIYSNEIEINKIYEALEKISDQSISSYIEAFSSNISGIGPVYALTLRYFISKGSEPIYDKYARMALWSILDKKRGCKSEPTFNNIEKVYKSYKDMIIEVFEEEYNNRNDNPNKWRQVDQALWAYGHCLNVDAS